MSQLTKPWPLVGYAPGHYMCHCVTCDKQFEGDKRAVMCLECAATAVNARLALTQPSPSPVAAGEYASLYVGHGKFAICDWQDWTLVRGYWWRLSGRRPETTTTQYAQAHSSHDTKTRKIITMHCLLMRPGPGQYVDHINGDGLDNRRANLRLVTKQQNGWNQAGHGGTSKYKGVSFRADTGIWRAYLTKDGKRRYLGTFADEIDAALAYNSAAKEEYGEYARLNVVEAFLPAPPLAPTQEGEAP